MALIECKSCGKQVSDKARVCPNCGEIQFGEEEKLLIKCPDCGCDIPESATSCPNCGCPIEVHEEKREPQKVEITKVSVPVDERETLKYAKKEKKATITKQISTVKLLILFVFVLILISIILILQANKYRDTSSGVSVSMKMDGIIDFSSGLMLYFDNMKTTDSIYIGSESNQVLYHDNGIKITLNPFTHQNNYYQINFTVDNYGNSNSVDCYCTDGYLDNFKIDFFSSRNWIYPSKKGTTNSTFFEQDITDTGISSPQELTVDLYVISTDGKTEQAISRVPLIIDYSLFK